MITVTANLPVQRQSILARTLKGLLSQLLGQYLGSLYCSILYRWEAMSPELRILRYPSEKHTARYLNNTRGKNETMCFFCKKLLVHYLFINIKETATQITTKNQ